MYALELVFAEYWHALDAAERFPVSESYRSNLLKNELFNLPDMLIE
jgi:hypothetical protein